MGREPAIEGVDLHDHRVIPVTFLNGEGVPTDPTYVYVVVQRPDGTEYVEGGTEYVGGGGLTPR